MQTYFSPLKLLSESESVSTHQQLLIGVQRFYFTFNLVLNFNIANKILKKLYKSNLINIHTILLENKTYIVIKINKSLLIL